ncbi:MAG TPA: dipeptide ABC transporter ATP-binding protein [Lapillicoccus sp.]|nr:dipeptide ABC transporter ATP-binding protein [Lapillicoccus sp.]
MSRVTLRPAEARDLEAIVAVFVRCFRESYAARLPAQVTGAFGEERARTLWSDVLSSPSREVVVAEIDGRVCGVVGFETTGTEGWVHSLYVSPDVQGTGVGTALLRRATAQLGSSGATIAHLWVFAANQPSIGFYASEGWTHDGEERVEQAFGEKEIRLSRSIESTAPILAVRGLTVVFGTTRGEQAAVRDVSLTVPPGATVALVGESGSGKSTTAAAINRLLPANGRVTAGRVELDGRDLLTLSEREMRRIRGTGIGLVPQDPMSNLDPLMRIGDQVAEALEVHDVATGRAAHARALELLDLVGIPDPAARAAQYPHEFSGGMRQRALIAVGLACRPRLLVADEPTSALDVTVQRRILDTVDAITDELGTSVLLITHDLGLAAERADTVAVMYRGEIVETGPAARILAEPEHAYTRRLLGAAPSLNTVQDVRRPVRDEGSGTLVRFEGVTKRFALRGRDRREIVAVDDVSFDVPRGQTVAIVGESGSGKSTTANLLLGLEQPTSGRILVDGNDLATMSRRETFELRRRIQPVFQNPYASLDPRYTVERSVAEPLAVHGVGTSESRRERVRTLLEQVALDADLATRLPHELSGGQRQRVAIARALALEPDLVVLDEAVSALDVIVQAQILDLLAELQERLGLTYLFISHDLAVVRMVADQVHVMRNGRLVESGQPDRIFTEPEDDYTRELLAAIPGAAR